MKLFTIICLIFLIISLSATSGKDLKKLKTNCEQNKQTEKFHCEAFDWNVTEEQFKITERVGNLHSLKVENQTVNFLPLNLKIFTQIEELNFKNNQMLKISHKNLRGLSKLRVLRIIHNDLSLLPNDTFTDLNGLEILSLKGNSITEIPSVTFSPLKSLKKIHLDENKLKKIDWGIFRDNKNLQIITMATNFIEKIHTSTFRGLTQLTEIRLSGNGLKSLGGKTFETNPNLKIVDFSHNQLRFIDPSVLSGLGRLTEVDFEWNYCVSYNKSMDLSVLIEGFRKSCMPDLETKYDWLSEENDQLRFESDQLKQIYGLNREKKSQENVEKKAESEEENDENFIEFLFVAGLSEEAENYSNNTGMTPTIEGEETTITENNEKTTQEPAKEAKTEKSVENLDCNQITERKEELRVSLSKLTDLEMERECVADFDNEDTTTAKTEAKLYCNSEFPLCNDGEKCIEVDGGFLCETN